MQPEVTAGQVDSAAIDFSIIIPAWNESVLIVDTVESARQALERQRFVGELIVVDNNSSDDTASKAAEAGAIVVFEPVNQISRARNCGAHASRSTWLFFVDADTTINPDLLEQALEGLAGGTLVGGGSTILPDRPISGFGSKVLAFWNWVSVKTSTAAGCFIYCRRDAFDEIGGFSEKRYAAEELLLSRQLKKIARQHGREFVILTAAPVVTSARKLDWYTPGQMIWQFLVLLLPGSTFSKRLCGMWYDRDRIRKR